MLMLSDLELEFVDVFAVFLLFRGKFSDFFALRFDPFLLFRQLCLQRLHRLLSFVCVEKESK